MSRPWNWVVRGLVACALATPMLLPAEPAALAQRETATSVALRGVSASVNPALAAPLRTAVEEGLAAIEFVGSHTARSGGFFLDATVTRLTNEATSTGRRIDCEVSIVVEDARRHAVRGVLTGRAHVMGDAGPALEQAAVRAAARGALRSLLTAIARR